MNWKENAYRANYFDDAGKLLAAAQHHGGLWEAWMEHQRGPIPLGDFDSCESAKSAIERRWALWTKQSIESSNRHWWEFWK